MWVPLALLYLLVQNAPSVLLSSPEEFPAPLGCPGTSAAPLCSSCTNGSTAPACEIITWQSETRIQLNSSIWGGKLTIHLGWETKPCSGDGKPNLLVLVR